MVARLEALGGSDALVVVAEVAREAALAVRNLPHTDIVGVAQVNPVNLLRHERVIVSVDALKRLEEWLA